MRRTSIAWLVGVAIIAFALAWVLIGIADVHVSVSWVTAALLALLALALWLGGRSVKRLVEGERTSMTPIGASRVAALAQASAWGGAVATGYFAAQVQLAASNMHATFATRHLWESVASGVASVLLVVVALIVEHWCSIPPDDESQAYSAASGPEPA